MAEIETFLPGNELLEEWDALALRCQAPPFVRPGWVRAWWRAFGSGEVRVLTVRSTAGELTGALPVYRRRRQLVSPCNAHSPLFGFVAADDAAADQLACALLSEDYPTCIVDPVDANERGLWALKEAAARTGHRLDIRTHRRSPYVAIGSSFESFCASHRKKLHREIDRRRDRLAELGSVSLLVHDGKEDLESILMQGLVVEASGKKGRSGTAIIQDAATNAFYTEMCRWAAAAGILRLATLMLNDRVIAFDLALEDHQTHYLVKTGYDEAFSKFGPGMLLRREMLARSFALGHRTYEFLGSDAPWKREWTTTTRHHVEVRAFAPTMQGTMRWAADHLGGAAIERLRGAARSALRR